MLAKGFLPLEVADALALLNIGLIANLTFRSSYARNYTSALSHLISRQGKLKVGGIRHGLIAHAGLIGFIGCFFGFWIIC